MPSDGPEWRQQPPPWAGPVNNGSGNLGKTSLRGWVESKGCDANIATRPQSEPPHQRRRLFSTESKFILRGVGFTSALRRLFLGGGPFFPLAFPVGVPRVGVFLLSFPGRDAPILVSIFPNCHKLPIIATNCQKLPTIAKNCHENCQQVARKIA